MFNSLTVQPTADTIVLSVRNNGGADATISKFYVNGVSQTAPTTVIAKNAITDITVTFNWVAGTSYELKFTTAAGNNVVYTQVSPATDASP